MSQQDELEAERRGNKAYEGYRVHGRIKNGQRIGRAAQAL